MKLRLTGVETEVLSVHLQVMRKSIKTVLKRNYGGKEGKRLFTVYDKIKAELKEELDYMQETIEYPFYFNEEELDLLQSFLNMFFQKVEQEIKSKVFLEAEQEKVKENMKLELLESVQAKVNKVVGELVG